MEKVTFYTDVLCQFLSHIGYPELDKLLLLVKKVPKN